MKFLNPYFTITEKINSLQRWIIIQSIIYYEQGFSWFTDKKFDDNSKQLVELTSKNPKEFKKSRYYYLMDDFDGCSGFDLPSRLTVEDRQWLLMIIDQCKASKGGSHVKSSLRI